VVHNHKNLASFMTKSFNKGIRKVEFLGGDANWALAEYHSGVLYFVEKCVGFYNDVYLV
jgi:hypothetical protein